MRPPRTRGGRRLSAQLVVGQPGAATHIGEVCAVCGRALDQVVGRFGPSLTVLVDECQPQAGEQEITVARVDRDPTTARPPD